MPIHCLYISYDGMTDPLGQSQVIPYLIGLSKNGYHITLLSCEKRAVYTQHHQTISAILQANNIDWNPIFYTKKPPVLSTIYDVYQLQKTALKLHKKTPFQIVHCRSYISGLIGLKMKKKFNTKFVFDMRGFWADERVDGKLWNLKNPIFKLVYTYFKKKERSFLENADYTISLTYAAKNEIHTWKHIANNPVKVEVIPCCADLDLFNINNVSIQQINTLKTELNIKEDDIIVMYLGSIGTWYMLNEMMQFFKDYKKQYHNAKFLFVTKDEHQRIKETAITFDIADSIIIRPGNRNEIPALISICHFSIFFILPSYSKIASSPTKQAEIMAMGKPIICNNKVGDTEFIVKKYSAGLIVNNVFANDFVDDIKTFSNTNFNNRKIIDGAKDYFSLENGVKLYTDVYKNIL